MIEIKENKSSFRRYIIAAVIIFIFVLAVLIYRAITWEPKPDPASEKIIREAVAAQLKKGLNKLTDEDFAKITELNIFSRELSDIEPLEKFANLEELNFQFVSFPEDKIPKWIKIMAKFGLLDINKRFSIDLYPLSKLTNLKKLTLLDTPFNIKSLSKVTSLQTLCLY